MRVGKARTRYCAPVKRLAILPALLLLVLLALPARADGVTSTWHLDESPGSTTVTSDDGFVGTFEDDGHGTGPVLVSPSTYDASAGMLTFDGHGRVIVPDDPALRPFPQPFSVSVHARTTTVPNSTVGDFDLIRKGLATDNRYWKVELFPNSAHTKAFAFCQMRGRNAALGKFVGTKLKATGQNLADGAWHTITCTKTDSQVSLFVDGALKVQHNVAV